MQKFILFPFVMILLSVTFHIRLICAEQQLQLNFKETAPEIIRALKDWQFGDPGILLAIRFKQGSFEIQNSSAQLLNELGNALSHPSLKNKRFIIQGHTDNDGSDDQNMTLSLKRAFSIKIYLGQYFSIPGSNLSVTGLGESKPLVPNTSQFNKRLNRRVEIIPDILPPPVNVNKKQAEKQFKALSQKHHVSSIKNISKTDLSVKQLKQCLAKNDYYVKKWPWNVHLSHESGKFRNLFKAARNETIIDMKTHLMWQRGGSQKVLNWDETQQYVKTLNQKKFAHYSDWRLPTAEELLSLIEHRKNKQGLYINNMFSDHQNICWTINTNQKRVWVVFFNYGNVYYSLPENENFVRAVRSIQR